MMFHLALVALLGAALNAPVPLAPAKPGITVAGSNDSKAKQDAIVANSKCSDKGSDFEAQIQACSDAMNAKGLARNTRLRFQLRRATAYVHANKFAEAEADYSFLVEQRPDDGVFYTLRGAARELRGNLEGAIEDYSKAFKLNRKPEEAAELGENLRRAKDRLSLKAEMDKMDNLPVKDLCGSWKQLGWSEEDALYIAVIRRKVSKDDCIAVLGSGN